MRLSEVGHLVRSCEETLEKISDRVDYLVDRLDEMDNEIDRLKTARMPGRSPIPIPRPPKALQSLGIGLPKGN